MVACWDFPRDSNIENKGWANREFNSTDSPISTMVREVCQNSKDAWRSHPVTIEFHTYKMDMSEVPDLEGLRKTIDRCREMGEKYTKNKSTAKTYGHMLSLLDEPEISMMRISDFNTTGLTGSNDDSYVSPWSSFIFGSGVSDKSGESGGSRGRGKDSISATSSLRTVFYSTLDEDLNEASIGCSYQITHYDGEDKLSDVGRYRDGEEEFSHRQTFLDPEFRRTEPGTDIYVLAFNGSSDSDSRIILTVIRDYFVEILDGNLVVRVNGTTIDGASLKRIICDTDWSEEDSGTVGFITEYIECYESGPVYREPHSHYEIFLKDSETNAIASVRSGMTIDRGFYRPQGGGCVGLAVIRSPWASETLIKAETASHDSWSPERAQEEDRPTVKRLINEIKSRARECIREMHEDEDAERLDAAGLESYIPMVSDSFSADVADKESLFDPISRSVVSKKAAPEDVPSDVGQNVTRPTSPVDYRQDWPDEWNGPVDAKSNNSKSDEPMTNIRPGTDESFKRRFQERSVSLGNLRTFCTDPSSNRYKVMFDVKKPCTVYLEARVFVMSKDNAEPVNVIDACDSNGNSIPFSESRIGPIDVVDQSRNFLTISVDYPVTGRVTVIAIEKTECEGQ